MTGRSHVLIAGAAYVALSAHPITTPAGSLAAPLLTQGVVGTAAGALVAAFAGLAPDLDKSGSKAARLGGWRTRLLAGVIQLFFGHRGAFHSLVGLVVAWELATIAGRAAGLEGLGAVVAFGWGVHLLLDATTAGGVPLLWPLSLKLRLPPGLVTGGLVERALLVATLGFCGWWAGVEHWLPG